MAVAGVVNQRVPELRIDVRNDRVADPSGEYVLYWMIMYRRRRYNFSLQRAVEWAKTLGRPLLILEALRCGYDWASDRIHAFVLQGMAANVREFAHAPVTYYPYVERELGAGKGLLAALAARACVVVTDDFPCFMLPQMVAAAEKQIESRLEVVDSNGLLPLQAADKAYSRAVDFRRFLQKTLPAHLDHMPLADPLRAVSLKKLRALPTDIRKRWPPASPHLLSGDSDQLAALPIDHSVGPAAFKGGADVARLRLDQFIRRGLGSYPDDRGDPDLAGTSGLSPYLHFGHISVHEIFARIRRKENWSSADVASQSTGKRSGWWGMSAASEAFLDELITWRELSYNLCAKCPDSYDSYEAIPKWAQASLQKHLNDARPHTYSLQQLEQARTHDAVWNAAHTQLVRDGWFHNSMRMLWAKKILEWSAHPRDAMKTMIHLMNKYSVDGRNPNSYAGYLWTFGRYDRPWGPERPIFGVVRYLSSENTARKRRLGKYVERYSA